MVREAYPEELEKLLKLYLFLHEKEIPEMTAHLKKTWEKIMKDEDHHLIVKVLDGKIVVETWPMPATRSAFPRYAEARTKSGELLFQCISLWALINKTERTLVLPSQTELKVPGIVRGGELPVPNAFATSDEVDGESQHLVCFSDLDTNGHANNTKYLEWVNDLLPSQFHKEHAFKDITLCYLSEALEGQTVRLLHRFHGDGSFQVDGLRVQTNDSAQKPRVFSALIKF